MFELLLFKEQEKHLALVSITYHITVHTTQCMLTLKTGTGAALWLSWVYFKQVYEVYLTFCSFYILVIGC